MKIIRCDRCNTEVNILEKRGWGVLFLNKKIKDLCPMCLEEWKPLRIKLTHKNFTEASEIIQAFLNMDTIKEEKTEMVVKDNPFANNPW